MKRGPVVAVLFVLAVLVGWAGSAAGPQISARTPGILLEDLTWKEAEAVLTPDAVVVIPIGAQAKEHGPHLKLRNDFTIAEYLKRRVLERSAVIVAPTLNYHYYPAFVDYPGSTTLRLETARDMTVDICRSLARFGPRRFYALNTGVSTVRALAPAVEILEADGILLRFTNVSTIVEDVEKKVQQQEGGTHADELETSMMLYIDPQSVDMKKAVKDYHPGASPLSRVPDPTRTYSASGTYGDATLATREKGRRHRRGDGRAAGAGDRGPPQGVDAGACQQVACCLRRALDNQRVTAFTPNANRAGTSTQPPPSVISARSSARCSKRTCSRSVASSARRGRPSGPASMSAHRSSADRSGYPNCSSLTSFAVKPAAASRAEHTARSASR